MSWFSIFPNFKSCKYLISLMLFPHDGVNQSRSWCIHNCECVQEIENRTNYGNFTCINVSYDIW